MRLFLTSIHKSGTAMFCQSLNNMAIHERVINGKVEPEDQHPNPHVIQELDKVGLFGRAHLPYCPQYPEILKSKGFKTVFIYRDLRDTIVSWAYWADVMKKYQGWINFETSYKVRLNKLMIKDRINEILKVASFEYSRYVGWIHEPEVFKISYESMILNREKVFKDFIEWMGDDLAHKLNCTNPRVMMSRITKTNSTFRKGIIGDWKNHFDEGQIHKFWIDCEDIMRELGYEKEI